MFTFIEQRHESAQTCSCYQANLLPSAAHTVIEQLPAINLFQLRNQTNDRLGVRGDRALQLQQQIHSSLHVLHDVARLYQVRL